MVTAWAAQKHRSTAISYMAGQYTRILSGMSELLLSVSGARGIVGQAMTPAVAASFAAAFAAHVAEQRRTRRPQLEIGRDGRPSGAELAAAAAAGARSAGARVTDLGIAATPTVSFMVRRSGADGGMVV